MAENQSKERKQAEAAFARAQVHPGGKFPVAPSVSDADQKTARLKAARLERDAAAADSEKP